MKFSWHQKFILISCGIVSLMAIASPVNEFVGAPEGFGSRYVPHEGNAESVTVNERKHKDSSTLIREMQERGFLSRSFDQWFVAANGSANGTGNADSPIDIITAFGGEASRRKIKPGDIVWLRGGSYVGTFQIDLRGTPAAPIHIREYPGERAVFDKGRADRKTGALEVRSSNVWFWDFEVANSLQDRTPTDVNGKINPVRGSGINVWKAGNKFINLIIHDNGHGIGLWNEEGDTEIYGCLIFNNGNNKKEHGIYGNNKTGTQLISNNIIFNNAGYGLHLYADTTSYSLEGFDVIENAIFNNGAITPEDQVADQILVGGVRNVPADRIVIRGNSVFNEPDSLTSKNRGIRLGYEDENNGSVKIIENYVVSAVPIRLLWWRSVEARDNTVVSNSHEVEIVRPRSFDSKNYKVGADAFLISDAGKQQIFVRQNKYEAGRANVFIHNADEIIAGGYISLNLNSVLKVGDRFQIRDAQDIFSEPLFRGEFNGKDIRLRVDDKRVTLPIGKTQRIPVHTSNKFEALIIESLR